MTAYSVTQIPYLEISKDVSIVNRFSESSKFCYEARDHNELPHVVKFSGGRSSGLMLFTLLESGLLDSSRGDVIVFNNTSAEHPATYEFVRHCKQVVEEKYQIPFLWIEFQTYEDSRNGKWTRIPSYRLVQPEPWSNTNPDGYHWKGEAFEELISWKGYVPNQFGRICTSFLKLKSTQAFLEDWLLGKDCIERLGHYGNGSRLDADEMYSRHLQYRGGVPRDIFLQKKEYLIHRPTIRPAQKFSDFSWPAKPFENPQLINIPEGKSIYKGDNPVEYLSFIGLRADEQSRVNKVRTRNTSSSETTSYEGEHVYMPLATMGIGKDKVQEFWASQDWNLKLNVEDSLSNCTYCFLKGVAKLQKAHTAIGLEDNPEYKDTPCDIAWWINIEKKYGRDLVAEKRKLAKKGKKFIGFFGSKASMTYEKISLLEEGTKPGEDYMESLLPCDCTD